MGGRLRILVCLLPGALTLIGAAPALAQGGGTTTSAGDQQYVDPLANTNPANTKSTPAPSAPAPAASAPAPVPTTTVPSTGTTSGSFFPPSSTAPTPAAATTSGDPGGTLPYTGLNLGLVVAVGVGLLVAGVVLWRVTRPSGGPQR